MRAACVAVGLLLTASVVRAGPAEDAALADKALAILKTHCHRCHGDAGSLEGGFNYVLDFPRLIARKKIIPGRADDSPLFRRVAGGKMPPPGETPRPSEADVAVLRNWIEAGAPAVSASAPRPFVSDAEVFRLILADLDRVEKRSRRFAHFSLVPLANAGLGDDRLRSYRNALAKLLNSLSWHPRITLPVAIDPNKLVLRFDLRRAVGRQPVEPHPRRVSYGIFHDTAAARRAVATATRLPLVRADWFVATASRAPLYYDLLQIPGNLSELERQLRVDVATNIQQERVARTGFNGSGISRNNRVLERHDAMNGAYWRTYDFEAVPQNLLERNLLLPDRRNIFAYPLGPGGGETTFQHAGGEVIFNLPNGLHAFVLINASNVRINKGPTGSSAIQRPDRAVEAGLRHGLSLSRHPPETTRFVTVDRNPDIFRMMPS
jgi:mono/diheme cytochrome c family protein